MTSSEISPGPSLGAGQLTAEDYMRIEGESRFVELRRRYRGFAFPVTIAFLAWYLLYVLASAFARGFMDTKVVGHLNVAFFFGLLQFVSTFLIAWAYSRYANRRLDPLAAEIRAEHGDRR